MAGVLLQQGTELISRPWAMGQGLLINRGSGSLSSTIAQFSDAAPELKGSGSIRTQMSWR